MDYALRSITFSCDLISRARFQHSADSLQKLHSSVFADASYPYKNFSVIPGGAQLANPSVQRGASSSVIVLPDRVRIQEQGTGCGRDEFEARLEGLAQTSLECLDFTEYAAQQFVVQSLINPRRWDDARAFLADAVLELKEDDLEPLGRKPGLYGVRLAFPGTPEDPSLYNVRIESYSQDARSLFLENVGVFNQVIAPGDVAQVTKRFEQTYCFLESNVGGFISNLDA